MAVYVTCPQCKQRIPFGRLFCTNCGAKLEINANTVNSRTTAGEVLTRARRIVIRIFVLAVIAGAVGLFLWPVAPLGRTGDASYGQLCQQRIDAVRARTYNGMAFSEIFSDMEINAWLAARLGDTKDKSGGAGLTLSQVNVELRRDAAVVTVVSERPPVRVSMQVTGRPKVVTGEGFQFEVTAVRVGHVPLPGFLHAYFADRVGNAFADFREQQDLLARMRVIETRDGQIVVGTQKP